MHYEPKTKLGRVVNEIEETLIALILGLMTVFLFAWLVLIGASYCVKVRAHLGVDVVLHMVSPGLRRVFAFLAVGICLAFSFLLLIGSWNYWAPFAALPMLDGTIKDQAWYEVNDIPMLGFLRFIEASMNEGEAYEKLPRFIPYAALPIGLFLLTLRLLQTAWKVITGEIDSIIAGHEAEELVEEAAAQADKED